MNRRQMIQDALTVSAAVFALPAALEAFAFAAPSGGAAAFPPRSSADGGFSHPGLLHSAADLTFIREKVRSGDEPWKTAWERLRTERIVDLTAAPRPVARVYRGVNNNPDIGSSALGHDSGKAYAHALVGALSPDGEESARHYRKAAEILDAWSGTLRSIDGHDQKLLCGLTGYRFGNAGELLRHAGNVPAGVWSDVQAGALAWMLRAVFYPPIAPFFPEANGNWDAAMITTMLSIGILTDDRAMFDRAADHYLHGGGSNGMVTNYVYPSGQCEETTRDQGHVQLGLGMAAAACRTAWTQGVDLYGAADNRLALGFEYTAKLNLGEDVPVDGGPAGEKGRGSFPPIYEAIYQHYAGEKHLPMPYIRRVVEQKRPEGYDPSQPGWGTLTAARAADPPSPAGDLLARALSQDVFPPTAGGADREEKVTSPNGALTASIGVRGGKLVWSLRDRANRELLVPGVVGITFAKDVPPLDAHGLTLWDVQSSRREIDRPRLWGAHGEQNIAPKLPFEQRVLVLRENAAPHRILRAELRVYDQGIALRLALPPNRDPGTQTNGAFERTEFAFPEGTVAYTAYGSEDEFHPVPVAETKPGCWLPLTARIGGEHGPHLSIAEVDETTPGVPQTLLSPSPGTKNALVTDARGPVPVGGEVAILFPWRLVLVGETPAKLAAAAVLPMSLWPESLLPVVTPGGDPSWIKPGKAIRETTLSTPGGIACIDFAAAHGLSYILIDAGWYGPENDPNSDARTVSPDRARIGPNYPGLDLPKVIAYGKEKGIGVFLYVNHLALEKQLADLAPLYESWGVAGMKWGFINYGTVEWTRWVRDGIALCAQHRLLVDIHDQYRPVGVSGLYPNLLTQEGIRGNEHMPTPRHNCTLPFTRFLTGPADYTPCYREPRLKTTDAHQMALAVLYFSPFQMLYWYGRPSEYGNLPELEFFDAVSTVWNETVWLGGEIGEWAAVARRSGRDWFVGAITNENARDITLPLDFLSPGTNYRLRAYTDKRGADGKASLPLKADVSRIDIAAETVKRGDSPRRLALAAAGGAAFWLKAAVRTGT